MRVLRHREHQRSAERTIGHTETRNRRCAMKCYERKKKKTLRKKEPPPIRSEAKVASFFSLFEKQVQSGKKREGKRKRLRNALAGRVREQLAAERRVRRSFYIRALSIDH